MVPKVNSDCVSAVEVARRLGVSRLHVYRLVRAGQLPAGVVIRVGRRKLRFDCAALESWIRTGGAEPTQAPTKPGAGLAALMARYYANRERSE